MVDAAVSIRESKYVAASQVVGSVEDYDLYRFESCPDYN